MPRYIDADRLINGIRQAVCTTCAIDYNKEKCICDTGDCIRYIEDCPTADVQEVKHGRWEYNQDVILYWVCSECAYYVQHEYKFCPNCGAKMDGGSE
jgi:hypothetical protein